MTDRNVASYLDFDEFDRIPELDQAMLDGLMPSIHARREWATDLDPRGTILAEADVRFLLVHHTATTNDYGPDDVAEQIRDFHRLHIGAERGWADVAYNFLIDRFGGIWEARAGSVGGAVQGDATGGSQGFAQLCSLIGNHQDGTVTAEAQDALVALLAWLAHRNRIDTTIGSSVNFVSRGSNRWPAGTTVTARTISGHRDMSDTVCPGSLAYRLLDQSIPEAVTARRQRVYDRVAPAILAANAGSSTPDGSTSAAQASAATASDQNTSDSSTVVSKAVDVNPVDTDLALDSGSGPVPRSDAERFIFPVGTSLVLGAAAGLIAIRRRRVR